eukprot:355903-Chlamydomonas_euryale.AAC.8
MPRTNARVRALGNATGGRTRRQRHHRARVDGAKPQQAANNVLRAPCMHARCRAQVRQNTCCERFQVVKAWRARHLGRFSLKDAHETALRGHARTIQSFAIANLS